MESGKIYHNNQWVKNKQREIRTVSSKAQVTFETAWGMIYQEIFMPVVTL